MASFVDSHLLAECLVRTGHSVVRRRVLGRIGFVLCLVVAPACSRKATETTDAAPKNVVRAARIVSLTPSTTEALFAIGAGEFTVGRSRYCDYPSAATALPVVGGFVDPNEETIVGLRPTLVVGSQGPSGPGLAQRLSVLGMPVYFPRTESIQEIDDMILGLGARAQHVAEAQAVVAQIHSKLASVAAAVATRPKLRVLLLFSLSPMIASGPNGFPDEMLRLSGAENVIKEGPSYPAVGAEQLAVWDPDVILATAMRDAAGAASVFPARDPSFRNLRAVREKRAVLLSDDTLLRPGPRVADGVLALATILHPEAFTGMMHPPAALPAATDAQTPGLK
jgi:iron complex transport system substrate-binding protein